MKAWWVVFIHLNYSNQRDDFDFDIVNFLLHLLIADLFLYCYGRDFMAPLSYNKEAEIIQAFNSTSRYLDDLLNIDNPYFEGMVGRIYPHELQLNKANASDTEAPFLD